MDNDAHARTSDNSDAQNISYDPCRFVRRQIRDIDELFTMQSPKQTESDLHDLWSFVMKTAMTIPANDGPAQKGLIAVVVGARELPSVGSTADGVLWKDLPFLIEHVSRFWLDNWRVLKKKERLNLAAFTARLVAKDESASNLGLCALIVLRETLETRRPLHGTEYGYDTSVADLLPAAVAWFKFAGPMLLKSSLETETSHSRGMEDLIAVGELTQNAGVPYLGFSPERWHFWEKRLGQLSSIDDKEISEQALKGKKLMREAWAEMFA